ncbi:dihydroorotate dehydrogenase electron transfer subunit [Breznakia sp. OttesenSCG-928-G09]|nr:dihydroorotate dehydrogenase electron transfer subunit [Breznakia sp. OttesenSCG-928-G09]
MKISNDKIISNEKIANDTYKMVLQPETIPIILPGQFVNIKVDGNMLRRPISVASVDQNTYTIIYKVVGVGTKKLSKLSKGHILDIMGPLGSSFPIHETLDEVLLIGGGVGVPPLYEVAKQYRQQGIEVYVVLGFNDKDAIFYEDDFKQLGCKVYISTMDGSYGIKGTVMDCIKEHNITCDTVYSCGPLRMLEAVDKNYKKGYLSFEARMACGIGACMGCVCKDKEDKEMYYRICKEGPVFEIGKVEIVC